jgi:hypothetical protein
MNLVIAVVALLAITLCFTLFVRGKDIPPADPVSPTKHLEDRRAAIYENLRDLQFEYRVGKLSDADYQHTKLSLQKELAQVVSEIERVQSGKAPEPVAVSASSAAASETQSVSSASVSATAQVASVVCPHCGASFAKPMKFCGECGKEMQ